MSEKNLKVRRKGMGWPIGAVIPAHALSDNGRDHITLGAVAPTSDPITHPVEKVAPPPESETEAKAAHEQLVARVRDLEGKLAGATADLNAERLKCEELLNENERLKGELEAVNKAAQAKADAETQAKLNAGPAAPLG